MGFQVSLAMQTCPSAQPRQASSGYSVAPWVVPPAVVDVLVDVVDVLVAVVFVPFVVDPLPPPVDDSLMATVVASAPEQPARHAERAQVHRTKRKCPMARV